MKGVILAGGFGTRLRPFTNQLNKGLAPIYTPNGAIPQILFPLQTLVRSGITEILIITSREHCGKIVELLGDGDEYFCKLTYKIQEMNKPIVGIAQALGLADNFIGTDNFAVILGDNYYENTFCDEFKAFDEKYPYVDGVDGSAVFLRQVQDPERFGVATITEDNKITKIIEKPAFPETNYAVTGLYLYTPRVFNRVSKLKPSSRSELEITDINNDYVNDGIMDSYILDGFWCDMGLPESAKRVCDFFWDK